MVDIAPTVCFVDRIRSWFVIMSAEHKVVVGIAGKAAPLVSNRRRKLSAILRLIGVLAWLRFSTDGPPPGSPRIHQ
ncbi:hypothetical protein FHT78_004192 [Rhizobium sp. BK196]|uniref:hypothetical protein n=1 Tax=Rhizobium sp. BK196 TaxID=2587073 RepID=UPI0017D33AB5|nr:hypothetical protein [Rhizobium sp. BK377]MBB3312410.1 hypothetical protein [Rhizobium sp. BK196]MBB3463219.1 hypothetical protein [Rhizobium sp. BK377]